MRPAPAMTASPTITSRVTSSGRSPPFIAIPVGGTPVGSPAPCSAAATGVLSTVGADAAYDVVTVSPATIVAAEVLVTLSVDARVAVAVSVLVIVAAASKSGIPTGVAVGSNAAGVDVATGC